MDYDNEQLKLAKKRIETWSKVRKVKYVGGFDISYSKTNGNDVVSFVVIDDELNVVYKKCVEYNDAVDGKREPYKSGYLAFCEVPCFKKIWNLVKVDPAFQAVKPEVVIIDGNGILHQRKCGSATHIGVEFGIPTIGVAKNLLFVDGLDKNVIKLRLRNKMKNGIHSLKLVGKSGFEYGYAWCNPKGKVQNPVYISAGNMIDNEKSLEIVEAFSQFREPEPTRVADRISRNHLKYKK